MSIGLSTNSRASVNAVASIQSQMSQIQKRLASGKKVSSAIDDPVAFFTASALSARASSILALSNDITAAQSAISSASHAVTAIQSFLDSAKSIATQALATPSSLAKVVGTNSSALTTSSVIASTGGNATRFKAGDTVTVSDGTTTATYTAANNDTVQTMLNAINNTAGIKVTASLNTSGQISIAASGNGSITIGGTLTGAGTLNGIVGLTAGTTALTPNTARANLAAQFDALRAQIDQTVADAGYNGVNLLNGGSVTVKFNESGTAKLNVVGSNATVSGLGLDASANSFSSDGDINAALAQLASASATLSSISSNVATNSKILSTRADFNKSLVETLSAGADGLTLTDTSEDSALLLALQTRQQLAITSLSLANGADNTALRLLGLT